MSLINDVLCDLESRRTTHDDTVALSGLRPAGRYAAVAPRPRWIVPLVAALLASSAFAVLHVERERPEDAPPAPAATPTAIDEAADALVQEPPSSRLATLIEFTRSLDRVPERTVQPSLPAPVTASADTPVPEPVAKPTQAPPVGNDQPAAIRSVRSQPGANVTAPATLTVADARRSGVAAMSAGQHTKAEHHFRKLVELEPDVAQGWIYLARSLSSQDQNAAGEKLLLAALADVSDPAPLARALARHLLARDAVVEALQLLEAHRPRQLLDPDHDAFIAAVQQRLGHHDVAAERYRRVLAVRPQLAAWWVGLAISEEARGRGEAALDAYRHARNIGNLDTRLADYADRRIAAMQGRDES